MSTFKIPKKKLKKHLSVRIDPDLIAVIKTEAQKHGTNVSVWVESAIRLALDPQK